MGSIEKAAYAQKMTLRDGIAGRQCYGAASVSSCQLRTVIHTLRDRPILCWREERAFLSHRPAR